MLQVVTTLIKLLPLILVLLVLVAAGLGRSADRAARTGTGDACRRHHRAALILFSLTGFEAAVMTANVTRDSTTTFRGDHQRDCFTRVIYLLATSRR